MVLSWQGQVSGPHPLREIQALLRAGKIHSLYRVEVDGEWILLRDFLADLNQRAGVAARLAPAAQATPEGKPVAALPVPTAVTPLATPVPSDRFREPPAAASARTAADDRPAEDANGLAIAAFVLSLFFWVPYLNGITWLLALILGHLATGQTDPERRSLPAVLAWVGLWLSYVEISFFLVALLWFQALEIPVTTAVYLVLHGRLLFSVLAALIGAGVLMLVVRVTTGSLLGLAECFVGALVPAASAALGLLLVQTAVAADELARDKGLVLIGAVNIVLFLVQMFFWGSFIRLPDDGKLGLPRAALVSLPYTVIFAFVGIAYAILFATLAA
jgi:hypothetical protein